MLVEGPDGRVIEFPDSMDPSAVNSAMQEIYPGSARLNPPATQSVTASPPQDTSWLRYPRMAWQQAVTGLARGAGQLGNALTPLIGSRDVPELGPGAQISAPPTSAEVQDYLGRQVLGTTADLIPSGPWERAGAGAVQGLFAAAPEILAMPTAAVAGGLGAALGGATEGATGSPDAGAAVGALTGMGAQRLMTPGLSKLASRLGSSETLQEAGEALQSAVRNWKATEMPARQAAVWGPVDAAIGPGEPVLLHNYQQALGDIVASTPTQQATMNVLQGATQQRLAKALTSPVSNWQDARAIRTRLGDALSNPRLLPDMDAQDLSHLYGAITEDLGNTATALGADDLFAAANAESSRLHQLAGGPLSKIAKGVKPEGETNDLAPERVAGQLLNSARQGGTDLAALRETVPGAVNELAAATLRVNPRLWSRFAPEAQQALVADPELRQGISSVVPASAGAPGERSLQRLVGARVGDIAGMLAGHLLPGTSAVNPLITGAVGEAAGVAAPSLWRGGRSLVLAPNRLAPALIGGVGGGDTLVPQQPTVP